MRRTGGAPTAYSLQPTASLPSLRLLPISNEILPSAISIAHFQRSGTFQIELTKIFQILHSQASIINVAMKKKKKPNKLMDECEEVKRRDTENFRKLTMHHPVANFRTQRPSKYRKKVIHCRALTSPCAAVTSNALTFLGIPTFTQTAYVI